MRNALLANDSIIYITQSDVAPKRLRFIVSCQINVEQPPGQSGSWLHGVYAFPNVAGDQCHGVPEQSETNGETFLGWQGGRRRLMRTELPRRRLCLCGLVRVDILLAPNSRLPHVRDRSCMRGCHHEPMFDPTRPKGEGLDCQFRMESCSRLIEDSLDKWRMIRRIEGVSRACRQQHSASAACSREVPASACCFLTASVRPAPVAHFFLVNKKSHCLLADRGSGLGRHLHLLRGTASLVDQV